MKYMGVTLPAGSDSRSSSAPRRLSGAHSSSHCWSLRLASFLSSLWERRKDGSFQPLAFTKTFSMLFAAFLGVTLVPVLMTLADSRQDHTGKKESGECAFNRPL